MFCPRCGSWIEDNEHKCPACGYVDSANDYSRTLDSKKSGCGCILFIIAAVIAVIFIFNSCSGNDDKTDSTQNSPNQTQAQQNMPDYITSIKNNPPPGYDTSITVGQAFDRYFSSGTWTLQSGIVPRVCYTGKCKNPDGTVSTAKVIFVITNVTGNEFYYKVENINVDGVDLNNIFMGIHSFWKEILSGASYK